LELKLLTVENSCKNEGKWLPKAKEENTRPRAVHSEA